MSIIGIDLGTTTTEAAFYKDGKAEIIKNLQEDDSPIIPSVVLIEKDQVQVGIKAKNQMVLKPSNTVLEIKRRIGTDEKIVIEGKNYTPSDISAMILKKVKEIAEFYLGEEVKDAVITVPASFNDKERKATKKAGLLAGLNVERIINEPTAAAIAYGINNLDKNMNILVYDFGGGTIDVTILELFNGVLDVKASRGTDIGGKDIDKMIIDYIRKKFYEENNVNLDINNLRILSALKSAAEECKKNLSFQNSWDIIIPYITKDENNNLLDLNIELTRQEFDELIAGVVRSTEDIIDETLEDTGLGICDIHKVVMIGGSTRVLAVKEMIKRKFGVSKIVTGINPDETVAIGAAIECALKNDAVDTSRSIVVTDACSYSLGVEVVGGKFDSIIKRDSKLPVRVTKRYMTAEDNQEEAEINVYEGESSFVKDNTKLDSVIIKDIPKGPKGRQVIDITFEYDLNGILNVDVEVISTGKRNNLIIRQDGCIDNTEDEKEEVNVERQEVNIQEKDGSYEEEEEEDYANIYTEISYLTKYTDKELKNFSSDVQSQVRKDLQDILTAVRINDFKKCRKLEHEILELMGVE